MQRHQPAITIKDCRHGKMLFLTHDRYIGRSLDLYGEFSEMEAQLFGQIVGSDDIVVEVGANIGAHTVHLAKLVGEKGAVFAFEPQRVIFQILCANVAINELFNVHTYHAAVGRHFGSLNVPIIDYSVENNFGGISLDQVMTGEDVVMTTLDSLELPSLRLLKVDVEGMEIEVLEGARQLIAKHRPILYVENDRKEKSKHLIRLVHELGYNIWWHLPPIYNEKNYFNNNENIFQKIISVNILCLPKESRIAMKGFRSVTGPDDWWQKAQPTSPVT